MTLSFSAAISNKLPFHGVRAVAEINVFGIGVICGCGDNNDSGCYRNAPPDRLGLDGIRASGVFDDFSMPDNWQISCIYLEKQQLIGTMRRHCELLIAFLENALECRACMHATIVAAFRNYTRSIVPYTERIPSWIYKMPFTTW